MCVHKPVIIGSGETDLKYGAALWFACCVAETHESPHHNVFHGQASIFMNPHLSAKKINFVKDEKTDATFFSLIGGCHV